MRTLTPKRLVMFGILMIILGFKMISCDGMDLGCEDGCLGDGFRTLELGEYPLYEKVNNLARARITKAGFDYFSANGAGLIDALAGDQLVFEIPESTVIGTGVCPGGCTIELEIADMLIQPVPPEAGQSSSAIDAYVWLPADFKVRIPVTLFTLPICTLEIFAINQDQFGRGLRIEAQILANTDPDTRQVDFIVQPIDVDSVVDQLAFSGCLTQIANNVIQGILDLFGGLLADTINGMLTEIVEDLKCVKCTDKPCPGNSSCTERDICRAPDHGDQRCVLTPLGLEAEIDAGALIGDIVPNLEARIWASLLAGGSTPQVIAQGAGNWGYELGVFGGTMNPPDSPDPCTEKVYWTTTQLGRIEPTTMADTAYHAGIGIREEFLDQAGYTVHNSGLLCLALDSSLPDFGSYISLSNFALLLPSIKKLTHNENVPTILKLEPSSPIDFAILEPDEYTGEDALFGDGVTADIALKVLIDDLKMNIYGLVEERYVRTFTLVVDVEVLAGINADDNMIEILFGLNNVTLSNFRVTYSILGENPDDVAANVESLISGVLGQIPLDPIEPIEIPGFDINGDDVEDLYLNIADIAAEMPKVVGGPSEYFAMYIYAGLDLQNMRKSLMMTQPFDARISARAIEKFVPDIQQLRQGMKPWVRLDLDGLDMDNGNRHLEYSFAVDRHGWTPWTQNRQPVITDNFLLWQGRHEIKVRARDMRHKSIVDTTPAIVPFTTDFTAPSLRLMREGHSLTFKASDNVATAAELRYRMRVNDGDWSTWSGRDSLDLATLTSFPAKVSVEVQDTLGNVTRETRTYGAAEPVAMVRKVKANGADPEAASGCASGASGAGWLALLLLLPLVILRRKSLNGGALLSLIAVLALTVSACSDSGSVGCVKNADCGAGEICMNGECAPAPDGDIDGDFDIHLDGDDPDGDDPDGDQEVDGDKPEEQIPCPDGVCPDCYFCGFDGMCQVQACDPNCDNENLSIPTCIEQLDDTCAACNMEGAGFFCEVPRCGEDADCSCLDCTTLGVPSLCRSSTGECYCPDICNGGCADGAMCCTSLNPAGDCFTCPGWCEGMACEPGFAPGGCDPTENDDCPLFTDWELCDNFKDETCSFEGPGTAGHESCFCQEMPPLDPGFYGRYNDIAVHNNQDVWLSAYNHTYGDLMVGRSTSSTNIEFLNDIEWIYLDGVPEGEPSAGPSGPRGGIEEEGDNVGKFTAIAMSANGWPRIAYQDADNGDLLFIYTNGETTGPVEDGDVDGDVDDEGEATRFKEGESLSDYVWTKIVVDSVGDTGYYIDMKLDSQGRAIISYMTAANEAGDTSALKLAMANSADPGDGDFVLTTVDTAPIGPAYCPSADCPEIKDIPFGLGHNSTLMTFPNDSLWLVYYHNTSYQQAGTDDGGSPYNDNVKQGNLKRARLDGGAPDPATLATATFSIDTLVGTASTLVTGDTGFFNSGAVIPSNGWWAVSFYNATLNQLQFVYDYGAGLRLHTADDGWRTDPQSNDYQVWLGADNNAIMASDGLRIVYQDQTEAKMMYYSAICSAEDCLDTDKTAILEMESDEYGSSYGYYPAQALVGGTTSLVSSYVVNLYKQSSSDKEDIKLMIHIAPPPPSR